MPTVSVRTGKTYLISRLKALAELNRFQWSENSANSLLETPKAVGYLKKSPHLLFESIVNSCIDYSGLKKHGQIDFSPQSRQTIKVSPYMDVPPLPFYEGGSTRLQFMMSRLNQIYPWTTSKLSLYQCMFKTCLVSSHSLGKDMEISLLGLLEQNYRAFWTEVSPMPQGSGWSIKGLDSSNPSLFQFFDLLISIGFKNTTLPLVVRLSLGEDSLIGQGPSGLCQLLSEKYCNHVIITPSGVETADISSLHHKVRTFEDRLDTRLSWTPKTS
jgi:hypothetical protein